MVFSSVQLRMYATSGLIKSLLLELLYKIGTQIKRNPVMAIRCM